MQMTATDLAFMKGEAAASQGDTPEMALHRAAEYSYLVPGPLRDAFVEGCQAGVKEITVGGDIFIKHSFSCANDALVTYEINQSSKTVTISMQRSKDRMPFFSSQLLVCLAEHLTKPGGAGIEITYRDQDNSFHPLRTDWQIIVVIGEARFLALIIQQASINQNKSVVELEPLNGDLVA